MANKKNKQAKAMPLLVIAAVALVAAVAIVVFGAGQADKAAVGNASAVGIIAGADVEPGTHPTVAIEVANYGTITAELYPEVAPITVENFLTLVNEKFYDGLTFHRIISGFMIQGGCPLGNGTGGSDENIKGEFSQNGVDNPLNHTRGVLSMARALNPDSASSQFFIMHQDAPHLDGAYAAFGKVLTGMEVVDAICQNTPVTDGNGTVSKENQPVITTIRLIENP